MIMIDQNQTTVRTIALTEGPLAPGNGYVDSRTDFDRDSRVVRSVDDDNDVSLAEYDGANRTVKTTDPVGNTVEAFYDKNSNVVETRETDVSASAASEVFLTTNKFDSLNRLVLTADNLGQATRMRYDSRNNAIETTDAQGYVTSATITRVSTGAVVAINDDGNKTQFHFDGLNRRTSSEMFITTTGNGGDPLDTSNPSNPDGKITLSQAWDKNSRLKTQVDDKGNTTAYDYDALNRRFKTTYADSSFEQTTFGANDNVTTYTDENGSARTCQYDQINRLTQCTVVRATGVLGTTLQTFEYDGLSHKTLCMDNNDPSDATDDSTVILAYDSLSRQIEEIQSISDGSSSKAVSSNWQANDHRNGLVYPNGRELSYTFDDLDRHLQVGDVTNPTLSPVAAYGYIGYRVLERTYKNGTRLAYLNPSSGLDDGYDGLRRTVIQCHVDSSNAIVARFSHVYNRTNNRLNEIREHHLDGGLRVGEAYTYDSLYRLTNFQVGTFTAGGVFNAPSGSQQWQLDGVGNWSLFTDNGTPKTQTVNSVNEYTSFAGTANVFDANKNLKDDGNFLYAFDFLNRLREVRRKSDNALIALYLYDSNGSAHLMGAGRRIKKITTSDANIGATIMGYSYDGIMTIEERDGSDSILRQYVNGQRIDEHLSMDTYTSGAITSTHYYHENALGNVIALTDGTGAVVERYTYEAYSKPEFRDASNVQQSIVQSAVANPFLFNGQRFDPETGFSYYRHRYLNHAQGRFVSRDTIPMRGWGGAHPFVENRPVNWSDPDGLQEKLPDPVNPPDKNALIGPIQNDFNRMMRDELSELGRKLISAGTPPDIIQNALRELKERQKKYACTITLTSITYTGSFKVVIHQVVQELDEEAKKRFPQIPKSILYKTESIVDRFTVNANLSCNCPLKQGVVEYTAEMYRDLEHTRIGQVNHGGLLPPNKETPLGKPYVGLIDVPIPGGISGGEITPGGFVPPKTPKK